MVRFFNVSSRYILISKGPVINTHSFPVIFVVFLPKKSYLILYLFVLWTKLHMLKVCVLVINDWDFNHSLNAYKTVNWQHLHYFE